MEVTEELARLIRVQIFADIDAVMAEGEFVIWTERLDILLQHPEIFWFVVGADGHARLPAGDSERCAMKCIELCAFNVHFDEIDARKPEYAS